MHSFMYTAQQMNLVNFYCYRNLKVTILNAPAGTWCDLNRKNINKAFVWNVAIYFLFISVFWATVTLDFVDGCNKLPMYYNAGWFVFVCFAVFFFWFFFYVCVLWSNQILHFKLVSVSWVIIWNPFILTPVCFLFFTQSCVVCICSVFTS